MYLELTADADAMTPDLEPIPARARLFWRNPSAAFFNFVLPLLFLAAGGAILGANQATSNKLCRRSPE